MVLEIQMGPRRFRVENPVEKQVREEVRDRGSAYVDSGFLFKGR